MGVTFSTTMRAEPLLLVIVTTVHCVTGDLGFFDEIHSGGYPSFEWLATDFAEFERETPRKTEMNKLSNPDKVVKRNPIDEEQTDTNIFNPSNYYYANIKSDQNDILEPVLKKVYEENKEDYSVPVYNSKEKTSLYKVHGIDEIRNDGTLPTRHRYQPLNVLEHSDKQQYILDKYVSDKVKNYYNI